MRLIGYFLLLLSTSAFASQPLAGLTIIVIGESHMSFKNELITTLPDSLTDQGAKVYAYGDCGASAGDWTKNKAMPCGAFRKPGGKVRQRPSDVARTVPVEKLIKKIHPDLLIVIIGDTMASYDNKIIPKPWVWKGVSSLTKMIKKSGTRCVWVGPAWGKNGGPNTYKKNNERAKVFSDYLSTLVAPCTYIDSLKLSKIGDWKTRDGQHFDLAGYEAWGKGITSVLISPKILSTLEH